MKRFTTPPIVVASTVLMVSCAAMRFASGQDEHEPPSRNGAEQRTKDSTPVTISAARRDKGGFLVHLVTSAYQADVTEIRVLLPDGLPAGQRCPVLFVLPVEAGRGTRFGDGLLEVKQHDLHNKYSLICVEPTFSHLPWYANHPTNLAIRQESYLLRVVVPFVDQTYPTQPEAAARWLLGFSKSGFGAWSLLLRHPELFGRAAAWDAPLAKERPDQFGMSDIFATQQNFEAYQITRLLRDRADKLHGQPRLMLLGYTNFQSHHAAVHTLLGELKIPHEYRDGPKRKHRWDSGWVSEAVELLVAGRPAE